MKIRLSVAVVCLAALISVNGTLVAAQNAAVASSPAKRFITEKDLFNFVWVADPQVSPDGAHAVFTRVVTDEKRHGLRDFGLDGGDFGAAIPVA